MGITGKVEKMEKMSKYAYEVNKFALDTLKKGEMVKVETYDENTLIIITAYKTYKIAKKDYILQFEPFSMMNIAGIYDNPNYKEAIKSDVIIQRNDRKKTQVRKFENDNIEVYANIKLLPKQYKSVKILGKFKPIIFDDSIMVLPINMGPEYYTK